MLMAMRPVEKINSASLNDVTCLGVGSKVSGLAPLGTITSTLKSPIVISSIIDCMGVIVTYMVFLSLSFFELQPTINSIDIINIAIFLIII